jgi:hypothetical protein
VRVKALVLAIVAASALAAVPSPARAPLPTPLPAADCAPIAVSGFDPLPVSPGTCPGVRPGALVRLATPPVTAGKNDTLCTMNFVFRGQVRRNGTLRPAGTYIGTAGHCLVGDDVERRWKGKGPVARDANGRVIGRAVYAVHDQRGDRDFALIRLAKGVRANPSMCHFGGPTGLNRSTAGGPVTLRHTGQGVATGTALQARTAIAPAMRNREHVSALGVVAPGDSGSGVIDAAGRAVGVAVTVGVHARGVDSGTVGITRLGPQHARARQVLGLTRLLLVKAPLR